MQRSLSSIRIEVVSPEVAAIIQTKSSAERLEMAYELNRYARERLAAHLDSIIRGGPMLRFKRKCPGECCGTARRRKAHDPRLGTIGH
jgi:hypothetical protein